MLFAHFSVCVTLLAAAVFLAGLLPLYVLTQAVLPRLMPQLEFLPLMLTSVYCTIGTMHAWSVP